MTYETFASVVDPKVKGTCFLQERLCDENLDFFLILSSYTGLVGTIGESNYASASTFQDAFARYRTGAGIPTRALDLGPIDEAGYVFDHPETLDHVKAAGMEIITLKQFLALVSYAISQPIGSVTDSQLALGYKRLQDQSSKQAENPLFSHYHRFTTSSSLATELSHNAVANPEEILHAALTKNPRGDTVEMVQQALSLYVSKLTGVATDEVDPMKSIVAHGGDSLVTVEFRNWLRKEIGPQFGVGRTIGQTSLRDLSVLAAEAVGNSGR